MGYGLLAIPLAEQPTAIALAYSPALEAGLQLELPDPTFTWSVEWPDQVQLGDGETEQIYAKAETCAIHRIPGARPEKRRLIVAIPGKSCVTENRKLEREGTVIA